MKNEDNEEIEFDEEIVEEYEEADFIEEFDTAEEVVSDSIPIFDIKNASLSSFNSPNNLRTSTVFNDKPLENKSVDNLNNGSNKLNGYQSKQKGALADKIASNASKIKSVTGKGSSNSNIPNLESSSKVQNSGNSLVSNKKSDAKDSNDIKQSVGSKKEELVNKALDTAKDVKNVVEGVGKITAGNKVAGAIDIAKVAIKYKIKSIKRYIIIACAGLFAAIIIFFAIMSPIIENMDKFKEFLNGAIEFSEKTNNMYSGLGFHTTDEAFFEELDNQYNLSGGEIDLALVMSALMYTETTNDYTTDYSKTGDDATALETLKEIITSLGGASEYTQGQILRARMLCKGMVEGATEKVTLSEFISEYGELLKRNAANLADPTLATILSSINPFEQIKDALKKTYNKVLSPTFVTASDELSNALSELFETSLNGFKTITSISLGLEEDADGNSTKLQIYVEMQVKKYSEDNFKSFLASYYIRKMPEFKPLIENMSGYALDQAIDRIIKEIYEHRTWYTEVYGQAEGNSEGYVETCVGAISSDLIPKLTLPVKVTSSSVAFNGENAYGITTARMHNGIDLNASSTGTKEGDSVFSIAAGKVVKVSKKNCNTSTDSSCNANGTMIKIKHSVMVDGTKYEFYSLYANLQAGSVSLKKGAKVKKGDTIGKAGMTGDATVSQVHFEFHNEEDTAIDPTNLFITCQSGSLVGDSTEEQIWFYFRNQGYSEVATAAAMGNLSVESGLEPQRVQGTALGSKESIDYTNKVDKGTVSKYDFVHKGPGGGGYGLAQWTYYTRKQELYEYMKKEKTSIGDLEMQLGFLFVEINRDWKGSTYKTWKNSSKESQINSSTKAFMDGYERPGIPHLDERQNNAKKFYNQNKGKKASSNTVSSSSVSAKRKKIVEYAKSFVGEKYVYNGSWDGELPYTGTDCSGFTQAIYKHFGYSIDRTAETQVDDGKEIKEKDLKPGDLIVYTVKDENGHVAIYIGNGKIVHAASSNTGVKISDDYKYRTVASYRNIVGD